MSSKAFFSSLNKRYMFPALFGRFRIPQNTVRASPSAVFCSTTVYQPWSCFASPYSGCQTVANLERYVAFVKWCIKYHTLLFLTALDTIFLFCYRNILGGFIWAIKCLVMEVSINYYVF